MRIAFDPMYKELALGLAEFGHEIFPVNEDAEFDACLAEEIKPVKNAPDKGSLFIFPQDLSAEAVNEILLHRVYSQLY